MKKEINIKKYKNGNISEEKDFVVEEKNIDLIVNKKAKLTLSMSPGDLKAFTYGFLLTSGLITSTGEIQSLNIQNNTIDVDLTIPLSDFKMFLPSGCGGGSLPETKTVISKNPFQQVIHPPFDRLPELFKEFNRYSIVFEETGGVHSAAISDGNSVKFFSEDIGRHNAVDKVIGKAWLQGIDFNAHFLLSSGRISGEIVKKVLYAGLRSIVSRSAPTCAAIKRAKQLNIGIIGFLRGSRFNIYA
ncbi:MAG: formate dehydrogenase accessory sulfurtransferase FdhD [Candidatus Aminicenantes bacterium]|jgi:FdhD protein